MENRSKSGRDLILPMTLCLLFLSTTTAAASAAVALTHSSTVSTCPMDFNYVLRIPWNSSNCHNSSAAAAAETMNSPCCTTLASLFAVALAQRLKETSLFLLPDVSAAQSCIRDFQSKLNSLGLPKTLAASCFNPRSLVTGPNVCARVENISDWVAVLGRTTALDGSCRKDLTNLTACDACVNAGFEVQSKLIEIDGKKSHSRNCFYLTVLYAAGIVNKGGPLSTGTLSCIFGVPLIMAN